MLHDARAQKIMSAKLTRPVMSKVRCNVSVKHRRCGFANGEPELLQFFPGYMDKTLRIEKGMRYDG